MSGPRLWLAAFTPEPRHGVVAQVRDALNSLGCVLDSQPFSNLALAIQFEVSPAGRPQAQAVLLALPLTYSQASLEALAALDPAAPDALPGSLNITFVHDEPDLRMTIPAVPG